MINQEIQNKYIEYCKQEYTEGSSVVHLQRFNLIKEMELKKGKSIIDFTRQDIIDLILSGNPLNIKALYSIKYGIKVYLKWLLEQGYNVNDVIVELETVNMDDLNPYEQFVSSYFTSIDHLIADLDAYINEICKKKLCDSSEFHTIKAILFLAWCGLSKEQACNVKKIDLFNDYVLVNNDKIDMPRIVSEFLLVYSKEIGYYRQGHSTKLIWVEFKDSEYLLRTSSSSQLSITGMYQLLIKFNKKVIWPKKFGYKEVWLSGIYSRAHDKEVSEHINSPQTPGTGRAITKEDIDNLIEFFGIPCKNNAQYKQIVSQYNKYKATFYD